MTSAVGWSACVSVAGLVFDIAGALLLFAYGLPSEVSPLGRYDPVHATHVEDEAETRKFKRHQRWSRVGLGLLILGFVLQAVGVVLQPQPPDPVERPTPVWVLAVPRAPTA